MIYAKIAWVIGRMLVLTWDINRRGLLKVSYLAYSWPVGHGCWVCHNHCKNNGEKDNLKFKHNLDLVQFIFRISSHMSTPSLVLITYEVVVFARSKSKRCPMKIIFLLKTGLLVPYFNEFLILLHPLTMFILIVVHLMLFILYSRCTFQFIGETDKNIYEIFI